MFSRTATRRFRWISVLAYALVAVVGEGLHLFAPCGECSAVVAADEHCCDCNCHSPADPVAESSPSNSGPRVADSSARSHDASACAICAALAGIRAGHQLATDEFEFAYASAPAFSGAACFDLSPVVFSCDARGPPLC